MRRLLAAAIACNVLTGVAASGIPAPSAPPPRRAAGQPSHLVAFRSRSSLEAYLRGLARAARLQANALGVEGGVAGGVPGGVVGGVIGGVGDVEADSVTNVQTAGVDEGGIVKLHGDQLIILRRGRLFSLDADSLRVLSTADAFGPDVDPSGTWYDELLVSQDRIVVIGFSYARGGTEVGLFDIDGSGQIRYRATYQLTSNDYYSSRNYASRLLGHTLVFYTPLALGLDEQAPLRGLPALRKWKAGARVPAFTPIYEPRRIYLPVDPVDDPTLHTVTTCDLSTPELTCRATGILGPAGRVFYVSSDAVYVWLTRDDDRKRSLLYRLPLSGDTPSALRVSGSPVDQFSFLEKDGYLNVLVRAEAAGDGMWRAEVASGETALLRLSLARFGTANDTRATQYRVLPAPRGYGFVNRFVGDFLLYGSGNGWAPARRRSGHVYVYLYAQREEPKVLALGHSIDRIEPMGPGAVVVGTAGSDLVFSSVELGDRPARVDRYVRAGASQGELRSHGFFYKPEAERSGLLGLPVAEAGRPGYQHLFRSSAGVLFLRADDLHFTELGALHARPADVVDDGCRASCVDWYGNARPLFLRGRILALLGYELVEGSVAGGVMSEVRRSSFAPPGAPRATRP